MSTVQHIVTLISYTLIAAVVAIVAPRMAPGISASGGPGIGIALPAVAALLHEMVARQDGEGRLRQLRDEHDETQQHLGRALDFVETMQQEFHTAMLEAENFRGKGGKDVAEVIAEVKVLQGLVERLSIARSPQEFSPPETGQPALVMPPVARDLDDFGILGLVQEGLRNNRVDLVLQSIVNLPQRRLKFYETFIRIRDDQGQMVVPEQYINIAEREGLIAAIDNMLLFRCVQLVRKSQSNAYNIGFFCNISVHSLADRHFFHNFVEFVADNASLAPNLVFEVAQSTITNRDADIEDLLNYLATQGFRFSMDQVTSLNLDFGALTARHVKYIKFNATTLLEELRNPSSSIAIEEIKCMIDRNAIDLIVEKIESEQMLLELLDLKIDFGQGYLFGEPRLARP